MSPIHVIYPNPRHLKPKISIKLLVSYYSHDIWPFFCAYKTNIALFSRSVDGTLISSPFSTYLVSFGRNSFGGVEFQVIKNRNPNQRDLWNFMWFVTGFSWIKNNYSFTLILYVYRLVFLSIDLFRNISTSINVLIHMVSSSSYVSLKQIITFLNLIVVI